MEEKIILINNLKVNYKIAGLGPAILILHGWGSNSERWQRTGELLVEKGLKVIIPDLPGFGKSQVPSEPWGIQNYCQFIKRFAENLNLEKFYLLGSSFGGAISMKYAVECSESIKKLFLVAPAYSRRKTVKRVFFFVISKILKSFAFLPFFEVARQAFYKFFIPRSDYPQTSGLMKKIYLEIINEDLSHLAPLIKCKTVIIWGENDKVIPIKEAYFLKKKIQNSDLIIIKNESHGFSQNAKEKLAEIILSFLNETK